MKMMHPVFTGPGGLRRAAGVRAYTLVRNVYRHVDPLGKNTGYTISHASGLLLMHDVPTCLVPDLGRILGQTCWPEDVEDITEDHMRVLRMAVEELDMRRTPARVFSDRQERALAKDLGGGVTAGSGSPPGVERDIVAPPMMVFGDTELFVETKTTLPWSKVATSFRLDLRDLEYLRKQALQRNLTPVYVIAFGGSSSIAIVSEDCLTVDPEEVFEILPRRITQTGKTLLLKQEDVSFDLLRREDKSPGNKRYAIRYTPRQGGSWLLLNYVDFLTIAKGW